MEDFKDIAKILEDNNLEFNYKSTTETLTIVEDLTSTQTLRSQAILLFAYMQTIFCLVTIYDKEIDDEKKIIQNTKNSLDSMITSLILTPHNSYYKQNFERYKHINAQDIKLKKKKVLFDGIEVLSYEREDSGVFQIHFYDLKK